MSHKSVVALTCELSGEFVVEQFHPRKLSVVVQTAPVKISHRFQF